MLHLTRYSKLIFCCICTIKSDINKQFSLDFKARVYIMLKGNIVQGTATPAKLPNRVTSCVKMYKKKFKQAEINTQ
jgi:hypothetical protein